jgi:predicted DNA-binding protein
LAEKEKTIRMTTVIPVELHEKIKALAKDDGRMTMPYVVRVLQAHVDKAGRR